MIASNIARSQGAAASSSSTGLIELGIFYQALRQAIAVTNSTANKQEWTAYLHNSTGSAVSLFTNATSATQLPLDRFSIGTEMIRQSQERADGQFLSAINMLKDSLAQQPRNADEGLWYYNNINNFTAYQNLSYADGMYSYPNFAILGAGNESQPLDILGPAAVLKQLEILEAICNDGSGLLVHGYDALKAHHWANSETGASPSVWGRSLAWYTLGVVEALDTLQSMPQTSTTLADNIAYSNMRLLFESVIRAQITALERATAINGNYGVWQVVDLPGASINNTTNFVETSASLMTAHSLLKSVRLELITSMQLRNRAIKAGLGRWETIFQTQITRNANGTLSLGGTSSIATLSVQNVDAEVCWLWDKISRKCLLMSIVAVLLLQTDRE